MHCKPLKTNFVMRKLFLLSTMLLVAFVCDAQTKVTPKLQKGDRKVYVTESTINMPGRKELLVKTEASLSVVDKNADGFVLDSEILTVESDADSTDFVNRLTVASQQALKSIHCLVQTDNEGKALSIKNYDELKGKMQETVVMLIDALVAQNPQVTNILSKEVLVNQVMGNINENMVLNSMKNATSPLALCGMTITTGAEDEYVNEMGMKMKRSYTVGDDGTITTISTMSMNKDDMKKLIVDQVAKLLPQQADMIKDNIDMVMQSGLLKMEATEKAVYTLQPDGWVKSIKIEANRNFIQQKITQTTTVTLKQ